MTAQIFAHRAMLLAGYATAVAAYINMVPNMAAPIHLGIMVLAMLVMYGLTRTVFGAATSLAVVVLLPLFVVFAGSSAAPIAWAIGAVATSAGLPSCHQQGALPRVGRSMVLLGAMTAVLVTGASLLAEVRLALGALQLGMGGMAAGAALIAYSCLRNGRDWAGGGWALLFALVTVLLAPRLLGEATMLREAVSVTGLATAWVALGLRDGGQGPQSVAPSPTREAPGHLGLTERSGRPFLSTGSRAATPRETC